MENKSACGEEKISDKAFSHSFITSIISILICIVVLSSMTYAWFTADVSSHSNRLEAGKFDLVVSVVESDGATPTVIDVERGIDGVMYCVLPKADTLYTVTLTMSEDTTVTRGFCVVKSGTDSYSTVSINREENDGKLVFYVKATALDTVVRFTSVWGLPSHEDIVQDSTLTIS